MEKADFLSIANRQILYGLVHANNIFNNSFNVFYKITLLQGIYDYWDELKKAIKEGSQTPYDIVDVDQVAFRATKESILLFDGFKEYMEEAGNHTYEQVAVIFTQCSDNPTFRIAICQMLLCFLVSKNCAGYEGKKPTLNKNIGPNEYEAFSPFYDFIKPMENYPVKEAQRLLCPIFPEIENVVQELTYKLYTELDKVNKAVISNSQEEQRAVLGFCLEDVQLDNKKTMEGIEKNLADLVAKFNPTPNVPNNYHPAEPDENLRKLAEGDNPPISYCGIDEKTKLGKYCMNDRAFSRKEVEKRIGEKNWAKLAHTGRLYRYANSDAPMEAKQITDHISDLEKDERRKNVGI